MVSHENNNSEVHIRIPILVHSWQNSRQKEQIQNPYFNRKKPDPFFWKWVTSTYLST